MEITLLVIVGILLLAVNAVIIIVFVGKLKGVGELKQTQESRYIELKAYINSIITDTQRMEFAIREEIARNRTEINNSLKANREEISNSFKLLGDSTNKTLSDIAALQKSQLDSFSLQLQNLSKTNESKLIRIQEQLDNSTRESRTELGNSLKNFQESFTNNVRDFNELQKQKFNELLQKQSELNTITETRLNSIRETVEGRLKSLQDENIKKLDEMRATVDEKLQSTVEKRFNESFKMISERLEQVHKGLGEMQNLASGVGDLKKVLSNVKTRGTLGEIQLGTILEQFLSPEQYERNATVKQGSLERVEFAIKLPGRNENDKPVLLPIDSKFPLEDYQRLIEAYDSTPGEIEGILKQFENAVKKNARDIRDKYINPPLTSDFAIMFVPTEGLYAEILRRTGLFETLQRDYKIIVVGPSNLVAFLSSLQMGFRTLAIEKRSSEVWGILGIIKNQFGKFGDILAKTKRKLTEATNVIDQAELRSRVIEGKLRKVEKLPAQDASMLLGDDLETEPDDNNGKEIDSQNRLLFDE
ncbi:MAG: DNA recombination protein RmuC [Prevotellaceae bacterium]|jgi:DNA recombination protein RmuC|nr:DNA recombination protein RmuC [Prevotellaceae bacterium]